MLAGALTPECAGEDATTSQDIRVSHLLLGPWGFGRSNGLSCFCVCVTVRGVSVGACTCEGVLECVWCQEGLCMCTSQSACNSMCEHVSVCMCMAANVCVNLCVHVGKRKGSHQETECQQAQRANSKSFKSQNSETPTVNRRLRGQTVGVKSHICPILVSDLGQVTAPQFPYL